MRGYEVRVTRQALAQMSAIAHYIAHDLMAPEAANRLLDRFETEMMKLSDFPKQHALGIRHIVVKNFLIYYWVDDEHHRVQVTAVIYYRRDQIRQLDEMDME